MHVVHVEGDLGGQRHSSRSFRYDKIQRKPRPSFTTVNPSLYVRQFFRLLPHRERDRERQRLSVLIIIIVVKASKLGMTPGANACDAEILEKLPWNWRRRAFVEKLCWRLVREEMRWDEMRCGPLVGAPSHDRSWPPDWMDGVLLWLANVTSRWSWECKRCKRSKWRVYMFLFTQWRRRSFQLCCVPISRK